MNSAVALVVLSCLLTGVQCLSGGAPPQACDNVSPDPSASGHDAEPQTSTVPYVLTGLPPNGNYTPGMSYTRECPNPRTSAYLTPNCRVQTCLYQSVCKHTRQIPGTCAANHHISMGEPMHSISSFQLTMAYMAGNVLTLIQCATLPAL